MTVHSSSADLHPKSGARFAFLRDAESAEPRYALTIYLADGRTITTHLAWPEGRAALDETAAEADDAVTWARAEALKLARVLRASGQTRLTRWRG